MQFSDSPPVPQSPAGVVSACIEAINEGRPFAQYLAPDALEVAQNDLAEALEQQQGMIEAFAVVEEEILGDEARVVMLLLFKDGNVEPNDRTTLIRTPEGWKITTSDIEADP